MYIKGGVAILNRTFTAMDPLEVYNLRQAGRGLTTSGIGPIYPAPLYLQPGQGIGNFFGSLFPCVCPLLWSRFKQWAARRCVLVARSLPTLLNTDLPTQNRRG